MESRSCEMIETRETPSMPGHAWSGDGVRCGDDGYDGPICLRCGLPDARDTPEACVRVAPMAARTIRA
jgi:hypothetical protein